ncbi:gluconolactonase [Rhizorhabdus wittichii DC-6]|nr:gluconolactonase [Rhizorhabdus wittichii DC-6]
MARVECVLDIRAESGETPVWSVAEQRLFWVDQLAFTLNAFDPATGRNEAWAMPAHISSFAIRGRGGKLLVALRTGLFDFDRASGALTPVAAPPPYDQAALRYNDGRCDRQGRYVVGSVDLDFFENRIAGRAAVYRLDAAGLAPIVTGITCSNGLAFSPDGRTMYLADTVQNAVFVYDYDVATGTPGNRRDFVRFGPDEGKPDGAEVDSEGGYWVALLMKGAVARYTPDGKLDRLIPVPVLQPTKIAFGGPDLATLYLTSAGHRHMPGDEPLGDQAGGLFAIDTGFRGIAEPQLAF